MEELSALAQLVRTGKDCDGFQFCLRLFGVSFGAEVAVSIE